MLLEVDLYIKQSFFFRYQLGQVNGKLNNDVILFDNCYLKNPGNVGYQLCDYQILW